MTNRRSLVAVAWSTLVWAALWGSLSVTNVLAGVAIGIVTVLLVPVTPDRRSGADAGGVGALGVVGGVGVRALAIVRFLGYFLRLLVVASAVVAWEVVTPQNRINQGIVRLPLRTHSPGVATVLANAISLTPGTVTIEVAQDPLVLYVHVLHLRTVEEVRRDLRELEERVLRAFDPRAAERPVPPAPTPAEEGPA